MQNSVTKRPANMPAIALSWAGEDAHHDHQEQRGGGDTESASRNRTGSETRQVETEPAGDHDRNRHRDLATSSSFLSLMFGTKHVRGHYDIADETPSADRRRSTARQPDHPRRPARSQLGSSAISGFAITMMSAFTVARCPLQPAAWLALASASWSCQYWMRPSPFLSSNFSRPVFPNASSTGALLVLQAGLGGVQVGVGLDRGRFTTSLPAALVSRDRPPSSCRRFSFRPSRRPQVRWYTAGR